MIKQLTKNLEKDSHLQEKQDLSIFYLEHIGPNTMLAGKNNSGKILTEN